MVEDISPHITKSWANEDISDTELGLAGYVMFRRDQIGRRKIGVISDIKSFIQAYDIN